MELFGVVARLVVIVGGMLGVATLVMVGGERFDRALANWRSRLPAVAPYVGVIVAVLGLRLVTEGLQIWLSWQIGIRITGVIYAVEGPLVPMIQSVRTPLLTELSVFVYLYGYVFLLVFPLVAYFCLEDMRSLSVLLAAFAVNYGIGLLLYTVFVAFGPRNLIPDLVEPLLYTEYPQSRALTDAINDKVNVFPSLHTSLSATVALMAWRTRTVYPVWAPVATVLAGGVVFSTMYLAIHWATDVLVGIVLGVGSVYAGGRIVERELLVADGERPLELLRTTLDR